MKTLLQCALDLAALGFRVFPVKPMHKSPPMVKEFWKRATTDPDEIRRLWRYDPILESGEAFNPAISSTAFEDGGLLILDVDPKHGGQDTLDDYAVIRGYDLPDTYEQHTPSGGTHYVYSVPAACAGSAGELGPGLDIRSHHNYVIGAGSEIAAGVYTNTVRPVAPAPGWLLAWAMAHPVREAVGGLGGRDGAGIDRRQGMRKAHEFLASLAPAPDGQRDALAYRAACKLRGFGLTEGDTAEQMVLWFKFDGEFTDAEIAHAAQSAYKYATGGLGEEAPGTYYQPIVPPEPPEPPPLAPKEPIPEGDRGSVLWKFNQDHAGVMVGNKFRIMWEFPGPWGQPTREYLALDDFYNRHAGLLLPTAVAEEGEEKKKPQEAAKKWVRWKYRRSYDGVVFGPGQELPPQFYNTWKGFAYEPLVRGEKPTDLMREALEMYKTHTLVNCAAEDARQAAWLTAFAAHSIQKPGEKPLVAVVFKGPRGNGKSSWAQRMGELHEPHTFVASDQRYLVGNFNGHMAETTWFVLEEAFWGGSKSAEGVLKELVTGEKLTIEQKFREAFRARNYMRIMIIGNEEWQVPAALKDERRWAVFNVEMRSMPMKTVADKKQVRAYFQRMKDLMRQGGYRYLLTYLMGIDLDDVDVNEAPMTEGLVEQIENTLPPLYNWWLECLRDGRIVQGDIHGGWPHIVEKARLRDAFTRYCDDLGIGSRRPNPTVFGRELHKVCPSLVLDKKNSDNAWVYWIPPLPVAREEWAKVIGRKPVWPDDEEF